MYTFTHRRKRFGGITLQCEMGGGNIPTNYSGYPTKTLVPGMGYLLIRYWSMGSQTPLKLQNIPSSGYPP